MAQIYSVCIDGRIVWVRRDRRGIVAVSEHRELIAQDTGRNHD